MDEDYPHPMGGSDAWATGQGHATSQQMRLMLVTEASIIRGTSLTWRRRLTDVLNDGDHAFVLLEDVEMRDVGDPHGVIRAAHAQVNLEAVLFAVADGPVAPSPEFHVRKAPERAYISLPPYVVIGRVHLHSGEGLRDGLDMLIGRFIPVTDAVYWSVPLGVSRTSAAMVAVNHGLAQILLPFEEAPGDDAPDRPGDA
jgi:hypothetical protein